MTRTSPLSLTRRASRVLLLLGLASAAFLTGCERPPMETVQRGFRGTGMEQVYNPRTLAAQADLNKAPETTPPLPGDGPKASQVYQNVQVLGDLSVAQFARHMASITEWVAPDGKGEGYGCAYCHNLNNMASDEKYTKIVARRMIQMTQNVNANWKTHVADTGVTCYTCHRGKPVPAQVWFKPKPQAERPGVALGDDGTQNRPTPAVGYATLPKDPNTPYLLGNKQIEVNAKVALPTDHWSAIQDAESTYSLMMHFAGSLGVNCTYCHNTQNFAKWDGSPVQKVTAWHGIRMVREMNNDYLVPLTDRFPANRLGPTGDVAKANCATCHQGAYKPLYGAQMAKNYPELLSYKGGSKGANTALASVLFASGAKSLDAAGLKAIENAVKALKDKPDLKVSISGYADPKGNVAANLELSKQRAFAVRDALKAQGVAESRISLKKPETPVAGSANATDSRRVDINPS
jgi:photosynthetic reaction center cytochrome c subunit